MGLYSIGKCIKITRKYKVERGEQDQERNLKVGNGTQLACLLNMSEHKHKAIGSKSLIKHLNKKYRV